VTPPSSALYTFGNMRELLIYQELITQEYFFFTHSLATSPIS
jgi:hypothetical protein